MIKLQLFDQQQKVLKERTADQATYLDYHAQYAIGDAYQVVVDQVPAYISVQLDAALAPALLYVTANNWTYTLPFNLQRDWPYPDGTFVGKNHYATARYATPTEIQTYRNLAVNSHDQPQIADVFPHVTANAETRGEMVFYAKNAIDGMVANESHGNYPYQSWGINQQDDAELMLDFGREVQIDQLGIVLRADYPHDSYWTEMTIQFSDDSQEVVHLQKVAEKQLFKFAERTISSLKLTKLIKDRDSSTFPALTEIEVYGTDIK